MPVPSSTVVIVSGPVRILINKKWKQRFCVIAKTPPYNASIKLFVYKEAAEYKKSIDLIGQSPFDIVYGLDSDAAWKSERSSVRSILVLTCHERLVLLGFGSPSELKPWQDKIVMNIQDVSYRARFSKCESGCKLQPIPDGSEGRLHVQGSRVCFYTEPAEACKLLAVWELRFVKRYMVNESLKSFIFEGDIGCGKFRGMQYFACEQRQRVYCDMKAACQSRPLPSLTSGTDAGDRRPASLILGSAAASATPASQLRPPPGPPPLSQSAASSCSIDIPQAHSGVSRRPQQHHQHYHHFHQLHHHQQRHGQHRQLAANCGDSADSRAAACCGTASCCCQSSADGDTLFPFDSDEAGRYRLAQQQQQQQQHRDYYNLRDRFEPLHPSPLFSTAGSTVAPGPVCYRLRGANCRDIAPASQAATAAASTAASAALSATASGLIGRFTRSLSMNIRGSRADSRRRLVRSSSDVRGGNSCGHTVAGHGEASALPPHEDAGSRQSGSHLSSAGDECSYYCDESAASASAASGHSPSSLGNNGAAPVSAAPLPAATAVSSVSAATSLSSSSAAVSTTGGNGGSAAPLATILEASAVPPYIRSLSECHPGLLHGRRCCLPPLPPQTQYLDRCPYINLAALSGSPTSSCFTGGNGSNIHLHYARLDHTFTATASAAATTASSTDEGAGSGSESGSLIVDSLLPQQAALNYTELDHSKTRAFQEIAAEQGARRHPVGRSASAVGSSSGGGGGGGGGGTGRRSFIRIFHRSSVKSD